MDIILAIIGFLLIIIGLAGSVLPLPGPPLSFIGILILNYTNYAHFTSEFLISLGFATGILAVLDYYVPIWGTKQFGGTKAGIRGSSLGMFLGLFTGPFGIFIGAFLGALVGEILHGTKVNQAIKAGFGSFIGFVAGIMAKLILCSLMLFWAVKEIM